MHLVKKYGSAESIRLYQYNDYTRCNTKQHSHHIWPCHFRHNALLLAVPGSLFSCTITLIITSPREGCEVLRSAYCLSFDLSVHTHISQTTSNIGESLWPWLGPAWTTMQYIMYFRFCERHHVSTQRGKNREAAT